MSEVLLAIDPGTRDIGIALYLHGELVLASWLKAEPNELVCCPKCAGKEASCPHRSNPRLAHDMACEVARVIDYKRVDQLVCEVPVTFLAARGGQSLVRIGAMIGAVSDRVLAEGGLVDWFQPSEWKGNTEKSLHQKFALQSLSPVERDRLPSFVGKDNVQRYRTDSLDAALLGIKWLHMAQRRKPYAWPLRALDNVEITKKSATRK